MTLIEVMVGFAVLTSLSVAFLYSAASTVKLSRLLELEVAGSKAISSQLDGVLAAARDNINSDTVTSAPEGLVYYLRQMRAKLSGMPSTYPIKVEANTSYNVVYYEFPVPVPGVATGNIVGADIDVEAQQYPLGRGVMEVFLEESKVPSDFYEWNNLNLSGSTEVVSAADNQFFDMDGDGYNTSNFITLFTGTFNGGSGLRSLPLRVSVRYYANEDAMNADKNGLTPGFAYPPESANALVSLTRYYIVTATSVVGL
ncbi:MAG: hypothetical protein LIP77_09355 [Planctomycetes bacterium]|nr:hypothetical protein [Planctomycetota bacterium]